MFLELFLCGEVGATGLAQDVATLAMLIKKKLNKVRDKCFVNQQRTEANSGESLNPSEQCGQR